ncbi:MAG TPA: hypothetical protein VNH38_03315 [Candidatus Dormibacteraeota bacterium]|nr:hypothetical protein [Candidatus Dormibacteraeota bacterium]
MPWLSYPRFGLGQPPRVGTGCPARETARLTERVVRVDPADLERYVEGKRGR